MIRRLIREPLVHFLLLAALIFAAYAVAARRLPVEDGVTVTRAKIDQMSSIFANTWQRPPTPQELKGLIDDYVKEEIYVREAVRLGIDKDDAVIRRRLRMKMEFLTDAQAEATPPSDADLQAYLDAHAGQFRTMPRITFEQVFINASKRGADAMPAANALLISLRKEKTSPAVAGDATLLPPSMQLTDQEGIAQVFGDQFAADIMTLQPGTWQGPIVSPLGLHLVRVTEHRDGRLVSLGEIRPQVEREWLNDRRQAVERQQFDELLKRYKVAIEPTAPP